MADLAEALACARDILFDHPLTREALAEALEAKNQGSFITRQVAEELIYSATATPVGDGRMEITLCLEAVGNQVCWKGETTAGGDLDMVVGSLPPMQADADPRDVILSLTCKGAEDDDLEEKVAYLENMQTLVEVLA